MVASTETQNEQDWIDRSLQGDPEAFALLVSKYQHMVHALTYRMSGSLAEAEDLAQETFLQAYQQLGSFRAEARFSSWLYRIAMNLCLNWRKRQQRREQVYATWRQSAESAGEPNEGLARAVQDALMQLPAKQRGAVVLTLYEGLNHAEAAKALGCSETTVSWRLFAARSKLKRLLKKARKRGDGL